MICPFCPCAWITTGRSIHRITRAAAAIAGAGLPQALALPSRLAGWLPAAAAAAPGRKTSRCPEFWLCEINLFKQNLWNFEMKPWLLCLLLCSEFFGTL